MPVEIRVPPLGESLVDAVVGQWLKGEGDEVSRGDTLVELETDKVNLDVAATEDGVLSRIDKHEGDVVTVGELLGVVAEGAGASQNGAKEAQAAEAPAAEPVAAPVAAATTPAPPPAPQAPVEIPVAGSIDPTGGRAAPAVRRLAEEHAVDLAAVQGTGPG